MALTHASSGEPIDVRPFGAELIHQKTHALFKSDELEVLRLILLTGKSLPPHKVPGEITVQCVEGKIDVQADGASHVLTAGQLLFLSGNVEHAVFAIEDSSALVTIALQR